jgi:hypothetical protein
LTGLLDGCTAPEENEPMLYHLKIQNKDIFLTLAKSRTHQFAFSLDNNVLKHPFKEPEFKFKQNHCKSLTGSVISSHTINVLNAKTEVS